MTKLVIVGGLTAAGKTKLALEIAKHFNGELINADSRQIYKYLDIGTNKEDLTFEDGIYKLDSIPIHLVNIIEPDERFNLYIYQKLAFEKINDILSRGKLPIIVGGTGLYIDSIINNYKMLDSAGNNELREELENLKTTELQARSHKLDQEKYNLLNEADKKNPRRLIRFIERLEIGESAQEREETPSPISSLEAIFFYPEYDWEELKLKINKRVLEMFNKGLIGEVKLVLQKGFKETDPGLQIMGYKEVIQFLNNEFSSSKCIELVQNAHRQYARKQRTWFEGLGRNYKLIKIKRTYRGF